MREKILSDLKFEKKSFLQLISVPDNIKTIAS